MMKSYIPKNQTFEHGERFTIVKPLKLQPPEDTEYVNLFCGCAVAHYRKDGKPNWWDIPLQYPIGCEIGIKETWGTILRECATERGSSLFKYVYKHSGLGIIHHNEHFSGWRSPATMPQEAIRTRTTVMGNSVKRVQEITWEEYKLIFSENDVTAQYLWKQDLEYWFNSHFAKPRPRRKNGEIVGYECWCWNGREALKYVNPTMKGYTDVKHHFCGVNHEPELCSNIKFITYQNKGKPLTIHCDPYVEIVDCEVK